jgi:adenylate cyclase
LAEQIIAFLEAHETALSAVAAFVVIMSVIGTLMRGAVKRSAELTVSFLFSWRDRTKESDDAGVDVSQPVPGFGGRPAIAVLPFDNMSNDPEQDYFADGITEDLLTALQAFKTFPVIARNSTFAYKGKSPDVRDVAKDLGAGYVLEGSVRKSGDQVRITAQLIDQGGHHIWADRYDRDLSNIFAVQDEICEEIVTAIAPQIDLADIRRSEAKTTKNMEAWDCYMQGLARANEITPENCRLARDLFLQAIDQDPQFPLAYVQLGRTYFQNFALFAGKALDIPGAESLSKAADSVRKALELDKNQPVARGHLALISVFMGEAASARAEGEAAVRLNPSDALAHASLAGALFALGEIDNGLEEVRLAQRLSPSDSLMWYFLHVEAFLLFASGRFEDTIATARRSIAERELAQPARIALIASLDALGREDEAKAAFADATRLIPNFSTDAIRILFGKAPELWGRIEAALRRAGWDG